MGMFDYVLVEYPLPDGHDPTGEEYQTKDTPDQLLSQYVLTGDGRLTTHDTDVIFHGDITFYTSNVSCCSDAGVVTSDNKPPVFREYTAIFDHGKLIDICGGATDLWKDKKHYVDRDAWWADSERTKKEKK